MGLVFIIYQKANCQDCSVSTVFTADAMSDPKGKDRDRERDRNRGRYMEGIGLRVDIRKG